MINIETVILILIGILMIYEVIIFAVNLIVFFRSARKNVPISEFSFGMGPRLLRFHKNEALYSFRLCPMGVFCRFRNKPSAKAARLFGTLGTVCGALMNLLLAFVIIALLSLYCQGVALVIIGILLFELIIFIHEFGHFFTAKKCGVKVNEFALGMGPKILKYQKGETLYSLRLLPIGGFCAMEGEDAESDDSRAFGNKSVWKRMLIVVAGAVMNILLGFVLMMVILAPEPGFATNRIAWMADNAVSSEYLKVGDEIKSINGYGITTSMDLNFALATAKGNEMKFVVERDGQTHTFEHVKFATTKNENGGDVLRLDFKVKGVENNFGTLVQQTFLQTCSTVKMVWASLIGLLTGQFGFNEVAGPIGMTSAISQATASGLQHSFADALGNLVFIMMVITVNLGVVNLLPLPALDGGRLIFLIIEAIRRKPVKPEHEGWVHAVGMILLLLLMAVISVNDIIRLFTS